MRRALAAAALAGVIPLSGILRAQGAGWVRPAPAWRWIVTGAVGLVRRENKPWLRIHQAINASGWDNDYPVCSFLCPDPSDITVDRPAAFTVAARKPLHRHWQVRLVADQAPLGTYPGVNGNTQLTIKPSVASLSAQAVYAFRSAWVGFGPSINRGRVRERADPSSQSSSQVLAGATLGAGVAFPSRTPWFFEASFERRFTGSVSTQPMAVPGSPDVPALRVPVTHTVLNVALGFRQ